MMCGCEPNYVCSRCKGTAHDPRYLHERDEQELAEQARYEQLTHPLRDEVGITRPTR